MRRMTIILPMLAVLAATAAGARGFIIKDLTGEGKAAAAALGAGFQLRSTPSRLILHCGSCAGEPVVDLVLGFQSDGTEERVRSGKTTMADLERLCRTRSAQCRITALDVKPAVGWVSAYPIGDRAGATAVIIRDGQLLTIRSVANEAGQTRRNIDRLIPLARSRIVGP
ncbi:hypothetical protein ACSBM8_12575 [Sphingomonas sp. ASY06-1R]|uniref:hypothetical protein n=1 Tax=Sphingomonas sp. ASY06-1R TaxID=3445771 RepID=UPI003FA3090E